MSYQQEEQIATLTAEIKRLQEVIDGADKPLKGPTRYMIQGDEVVWKIFPEGSDMEGWDKDPYALMTKLEKPDNYVAVPLEETEDGDQS